MKKKKTLKIRFESIDQFIERTTSLTVKAAQSRIPILSKKDTLTWVSVDTYQQFMTGQKYAMLAAISQHEPQSIYQLAKILARPQQNVARDCELLEGHGFIRFETRKSSRKSKIPRLTFEYTAIEVFHPVVHYSFTFDKIA